MASRMLGTDDFPAELKTILLEMAEGVPLFVEEVVKTLLDVGVLQRQNDSYHVASGLARVSVPDTIQGIIMARLDHLGEAGKRTVQLASVIGRQFLVRLLERIAGLTEQLDGVLAELQALELIYRQGLLPEPAYVFKHAVIQDVAYNSLLLRQRKDLHRTVGYAIEDLYADRLTEHYAELAHHFTQGEAWEKAMAYSVLAGDRAAHAFASAEARRHYSRALEAASQLAPAPAPGTLASLHKKHAVALTALTEYETAAAEYQRALDLIRQAGDRRHEIEILVGLSNLYNWYHRQEPAMAYNDQALAMARELGDQAAQAACLAIRVVIRNAYYGQILLPQARGARPTVARGHPGSKRTACGGNADVDGSGAVGRAHPDASGSVAQQGCPWQSSGATRPGRGGRSTAHSGQAGHRGDCCQPAGTALAPELPECCPGRGDL